MATPSFEELLGEARRLGEAKARAGDVKTENIVASILPQLLATGVFANFGGEPQTFAGEISPDGQRIAPYANGPRQTNRSVFDLMRGTPGMEKPAEGQTPGIPLTSGDFKDIFVSRAKNKVDHISSDESPIGAVIAERAKKKGLPVDENTTFKQLKILAPETMVDANGRAVITDIFGTLKSLPGASGSNTKKFLTGMEETKISDFDNFIASMENILNKAKTNKDKFGTYVGPTAGKSQQGGFFGTPKNFALKYIKPEDVQTFESEVGQMQQDYRKSVTGAQAAFQELGLIFENLPNTQDKDIDTFISKGEATLKKLKAGRGRFINLITKTRADIEAGALDGGPKKGDIQDGYEFLGGDPSDPNSWKKAS